MKPEHAVNKERLISLFPETLSYCFEKLAAAIEDPGFGKTKTGEVALHTIRDVVARFRAALVARDLIEGHRTREFEAIEYPLEELDRHFNGAGLLADPRAALIFVDFVRSKVRDLEQIAWELDQAQARGVHAVGSMGRD